MLCDLVDRGLVRKLLALCVVFDGALQVGRDPLQQRERQRRLALRQQVDLQFEVIASLEGLVRNVLPDQDAGCQKDSLEREHEGKQRKGIFVKAPTGRRS